jgi:hypothetical protein
MIKVYELECERELNYQIATLTRARDIIFHIKKNNNKKKE